MVATVAAMASAAHPQMENETETNEKDYNSTFPRFRTLLHHFENNPFGGPSTEGYDNWSPGFPETLEFRV